MSSHKRIVIITGVFIPEPIVSAGIMADLAESLSRKFEVTVLRPHPTRPKGFNVPPYDFKEKPYDVIELDSYNCPKSSLIGRFKESISMGYACKRYLDTYHDEIKLVYNAPWHIFGREIVRKACNKYGIPYITPVQDVYPESLTGKFPPIVKGLTQTLLLPFDKKLLKDASLVHTISEKMKLYLSSTRKIPKSKFIVIRNWQNEQDFVDFHRTHKNEEKEEIFTFMYLGNIGPVAGVDLLLQAFEKANLPTARLVIAGAGSAKSSLQEYASKLNANIEFWDVPFGQVPAVQNQAHVMCLPIRKGFASSSIPSKLPAYMFSAKPIICCADLDSDTVMCINEADAGWTIEPDNIDKLSSLFQQVATESKTELKRKGENGFRYGISNFSRNTNLQKLTEVCEKLIKTE